MSERPAFRSTRSEQPIKTSYIDSDEDNEEIKSASKPSGSNVQESSSTSASSAPGRNRSRQESISSYLHSMDLQYPALASLRDALLGYLGEAEMIVVERIKGRQAAEAQSQAGSSLSSSYFDGTAFPSQNGHLDAAALGLSSGSSLSNAEDDSESTGSTLRRRGKALRRSLSGSIPTPQLPSPEALLAHLSAIREDVISSLPAIPQIIPFGLPSLPSRASLTNLAQAGNVHGLLQGLPQRLGVLHEHLPGLIGTGFPYHHQPAFSSNYSEEYGEPRASSPPPPGGLAARLSAENRKRVMGLVKNLLPSEDWSGWEKLGWEDYDDDEDEEDYPTWSAPKAKVRLGTMRRSQSYKSPSSHQTPRDNAEDSSSIAMKLSPKSMIKRLYNPSKTEIEVEEEPEYMFPNKTPAAAMRRQQSYAVKREVRELRRARSVSLSALGEGQNGLGTEMRRTKSRDDGSVWKVVLTDSEDEDEDGWLVRTENKVDGVPVDGKEIELEEGEELEVEIEEVATLDVGPTVHEALGKSENGTKLIVFDDLPWWMRNNEYVTGGYRQVVK